jgi:glucosamine-6-phosphate deaminase
MKNNFKCDRLSVEIYENKKELGRAAADLAEIQINDAIGQKGQAVIIFASAGSQIEFIESLITRNLDWNRLIVFHLDEYIGISKEHPASFRRFLYDRIFDKVIIGKYYLIEGDRSDSERECKRIDKIFSEHQADIACIGIGENGHIAFNEPPANFNDEVNFKIIELDHISRMQQVKEGWFKSLEDVPENAITMTIPAILSSKSIVCVVPDERKAEAVKNTLEGSISPDVPASILRNHLQSTLLLDILSASSLTKYPNG